MTDQLFTGSYPSDALTEAKQLRAENETLRRDYGLMQTDRNNLRSLLDATEAKVDELHDKLDDAQSEAKALRARVQELENGIKCALGCLDDPTGGTCVQDARKAQFVLRDALEVAPEPFCAALQKQEGE